MLKNIIIGGAIGWFFGAFLAILGAMWLLFLDWGPIPVFGAGAVILYLILRHRPD